MASMADISFTLLILFLVVTSMDDDKGLTRMLPPVTEDVTQLPEVTERNVLTIEMTADNSVMIQGEKVAMKDVKTRVMNFVDNPDNLPDLPEKHEQDIELLGKCMVTDGHVIQLEADTKTEYETYFKVQDAIVAAYRQLRDNLAQKRFHASYEDCNERQREALRTYYPQRVSEIYNTEGGTP
jgi:biopolymer transport protein ExbD